MILFLIYNLHWLKIDNFVVLKTVKDMYITIKVSNGNYRLNHKLEIESLVQNRSAMVNVVCEERCYQNICSIENSVCEYLNGLMPEGYRVYTHHVRAEVSTGADKKGMYVEAIVFQVLFEYA